MTKPNAKEKPRRPTRLQWQLVRAYTLSLTLFVAVLELMLFLMLYLPTVSYLNNPELIIDEVLAGADEAAPYLDATPPRIEEITAELQNATGEIVINPNSPQLDLMFFIQGPPWAYIAVADDKGVVLTCSPAGTWEIGEPLASQPAPGESALIDKALTGEPAWEKSPLPPQGFKTVIAAPIVTEDNRQVGTLLMRHEVPFDMWQALKLLWNFLAPSLIVVLFIALVVGLFVGWISGRGIVRRFSGITHAATSWSRGDLSVRINPLGRDELGQVAQQLNDMAGQLDVQLSRQRDYAASEERSKLARDLHDTVKQQVFATALELATAQAKQQTNPDEARGHLLRASEMVQQVQADLSAIVTALRSDEDQPPQDLPSLLRATLTAWSRQTGIAATYTCDNLPLLAWELAISLIRILQGSLANISRHSRATEAMVELRLTGGLLHLSIKDNGCGFTVTPENLSRGGLAVLHERAASLPDGRIEIQSSPDEGTRVSVHCRIEEASK